MSAELTQARYDVAVIGLGALGAASLWRLAEQGVKVIGVEQFSPPHDRGATHGKTRLFRTFCLEHPALGEYANLSRQLFAQLEALTGETLLTLTGGTIIGRPDSHAVSGTLAAAKHLGVALPVWDARELGERQPQHLGLEAQDIAVWDPDAGVANPEGFIRAALQRARTLSAQVLSGVDVLKINETSDGVRLSTSAGEIHAAQVVVANGAWLQRFAQDLPLDPIRTVMTWFEATEGYSLADFPVFVREISPQLTLWGHGALAGGAVKLGLGDIGVSRTPLSLEHIERRIFPQDIRDIRQAVGQWLGGINPQPASAHPCMITRTPDAQFVVGRYARRVLVAGGDSGHAFKHAPAIGEVIAHQALEKAIELDTRFIDPARFR